MSQVITVLTAADLHRTTKLYGQLGEAVAQHKPDVLALVGDFLDATGNNSGKLNTEEAAQALGRLSCPETVFIRGNHEDSAWFSFAEVWKQSGKELHMLDGSLFSYGPLIIVGFPCLMVHGDGLFDAVPADPEKWLPKLIRPHGPAARSLWLMHEPPIGTELSAGSGLLAGHVEWTSAIERFFPKLVVFGHDHLTPIRRRKWHQRLSSGTSVVNVGQMEAGPLRYAVIQLEFPKETPCLPSAIKITAYPDGDSVKL